MAGTRDSRSRPPPNLCRKTPAAVAAEPNGNARPALCAVGSGSDKVPQCLVNNEGSEISSEIAIGLGPQAALLFTRDPSSPVHAELAATCGDPRYG
eukprot:3210022-Prymnesium_polylepis.1